MTPLELQLEGFTVYRQHTTVDWRGADTALFAVTGPTGAGKSTLLDAITYVLYGKTARLGGKGLGGLISPGSESLFAQLTFRTARGVHRATRVAQRRAASVGTEVRIEIADPQAAGGWRQLAESERVKDANQALEQIVGLDYDGFTRAVLLPQGAFDEFLRGDASLRRQLLSSLLGLDKVERIQQLASGRSASLKAEAEARRTLLQTEYADVTPETLKALELELNELLAFVTAETSALEKLDAELSQTRESLKLLEERAALQARRSRLQQESERQSQLLELLERGRRAAGVTQHVQRRDQAAERAVKAAEDTALREAELAAAERQLEATTSEVEGARAQAEQAQRRLTTEIAALQEAMPHYDALTERGGSLALAAAAPSAQLLDLNAWSDWVTAEQLVTPFERALNARAAAARELERLTQQVAEHGRSVTEAQAAQQQRVAAGKKLRETVDRAEAELAAAQRADLAATLREGLKPGDACPVCGGAVGDHAPGSHSANLQAKQAALKSASTQLEAALKEYDAERTALTRHETHLANARERAAAAETGLSDATAAVSAALGDLERHGVAPTTFDRDAGGVPGAAAGAELRRGLAATRAAALSAHAAATLQRLQQAGVEVPQGSEPGLLLEERRRQLEGHRAQLLDLEKRKDAASNAAELARTRLLAATENEALFSGDLAAASGVLEEAVREAGFLDVADAEGAVVDPAELRAMEAERRAHEQALEQVERREVELAALLAARPVLPGADGDLGQQIERVAQLVADAGGELRQRKQALDSKQQKLGAERERLERARDRLSRSVELRRELSALDAQHALHHQLNTDLHGHRFPEHLLTQVQQVLARRASAILQLVTDGRYDLRLEAGDYLVADAWAGGELRSARTLSGGESFVASLALALALSDTLAGSSALGALFLDEGFGTLDRATLEAVTGVLESLTDEGRMVGVITHVPELSARLPARLVVSRGPGGSTVSWDT
ncbi:MAG: SMC family ATPase [Trueperaceae bacterium]